MEKVEVEIEIQVKKWEDKSEVYVHRCCCYANGVTLTS